MSKVLLRTIQIWKCDTDYEAEEIIKEASLEPGDLAKKTVEIKTKKSKGEIVAATKRVTTQVDYADQWDDYDGGME